MASGRIFLMLRKTHCQHQLPWWTLRPWCVCGWSLGVLPQLK